MSGSTGSTGSSGGTAAPGDVYISSSIDVSGYPVNPLFPAMSLGDLQNFLGLFIPVLLSKSFAGSSTPLNIPTPNDDTGDFIPEIELLRNISFTQYTDFAHPDANRITATTYRLSNNTAGKRIILRRDKSKKLKAHITPTTVSFTPVGGVPFEIQIRQGANPTDPATNPNPNGFPTTPQVDFLLYYLAKVGYFDDITRVRNAFRQAYNALTNGTQMSAADVANIEIRFTPPVQIGINDKNCGGYSIPGSDKRTAIAVLHDRVECLQAAIYDMSGGVAGPILPQYVAYDHGLGDLNDTLHFPNTPVTWSDWYALDANNPFKTSLNDMVANLSSWVVDGKVLVFASPLGSGTLSIFLSDGTKGFPYSEQETNVQDDNGNPSPKDGVYIRLCNGNNPYNVNVNQNNGITAYDDRFIFYDKYYRVLANLTPGESVRVTWCSSQPVPGWISIVGT
jgi:hypothetical protein